MYIRLFYKKYLYISIAEILFCGLFHLKHIADSMIDRRCALTRGIWVDKMKIYLVKQRVLIHFTFQ